MCLIFIILLHCNVIVWQAFKDKLEYNTWYDACRCHDVHVLRWLVNQGYKCLVTDMMCPSQGKPAYIPRLASKGAHVAGGCQDLVPQNLGWQEDHIGHVCGAWLPQCGDVVP